VGEGGTGREVLSSEFWVLSLGMIGEGERVRSEGLGVRGEGRREGVKKF